MARKPRSGRDDSRSQALQLSLPLFDLPPLQPRAGTGAPSRRAVLIGGQWLEYRLQRSRRRSIGLVVDDAGLTVTAPRWVALAEIESAVREKYRWVRRKLAEWREHAARRERLAVRGADGQRLPYLGRVLTMRLHAGLPEVRLLGDVLHVDLPPAAGADQLRDRVHGWLQARARVVFAERLERFARLTGRAPRRWRLSSARTRWGSCTSDGTIRLNWKLLHFPLEIVDYVIAHELAHLTELNHGPRFWATVRELFPDYARARDALAAFPSDIDVT
ncbi:MAG: M48 family metallopeptidase [Burkholderiales bacterium]|nr:MAG: M48 family metallopeptidase [Burkholderiales bacterium]